jgi:uncharacterized protein (DUF488 family)
LSIAAIYVLLETRLCTAAGRRVQGEFGAMKFDAYSMGFSNRTREQTLEILATFAIECLVDIRTLPGSKHTPQFNLEHIQKALPEAGIEYVHMKNLGGLRKPLKGSVTNSGWRNDSFRGYADYMQTREFETAINALADLLTRKTSVYCCTEAVFWRCHRQLVSDALFVRGFRIGHIFSSTQVEEHKLTSFSKADGLRITYPADRLLYD